MPDVTEPETKTAPAAAPIDYNQMGAAIAHHVRPMLQQQAPATQQPSEYDQTRKALIDSGVMDEATGKGIDALLNARIRDKEIADEQARNAAQAKAAETQRAQSLQQRSDATITEIDKMIARFGGDNALVSKSKLSIRANVIAAFDADKALVDRFHKNDVDYGAIEKLVIREVNEYLPEGQRAKNPGGPAIKNEKPPEGKVTEPVDMDSLNEKDREFVNAQINFWKKQPGYQDDLPKAQQKAFSMFQAAEEKRKSKK